MAWRSGGLAGLSRGPFIHSLLSLGFGLVEEELLLACLHSTSSLLVTMVVYNFKVRLTSLISSLFFSLIQLIRFLCLDNWMTSL